MESSAATSDPVADDRMDKYHDYLKAHYEGGCERFFSPTGFLEEFQKTLEVETQHVRNHMFAKSVDDAEKLLQPILAGDEGVYDLTAEPGTGKTSVLPFRFPSKRVVVALPTPFDAWSAYQMATGECSLRIKGLSLGPKKARVVYTDSYLAAKALLSNYLDYDIMIVDECDSNRGVTKFLAEVRAPGKYLIRMSASYGRTASATSRSFRVTESEDMPDVRNDIAATANFVKTNHKFRSLVLVPDAQTAMEMGALLPQSKVVCTKTSLGDIQRVMVNQEGERLYVADDTCARGLNLNLDAVFDCQLISEYGAIRGITKADAYQRKGRVGRNRPGFYFSPGLGSVDVGDSDMDVLRHNVVRSLANVKQQGGERLHVSKHEGQLLMCSPREPYMIRAEMRLRDAAVMSSPESDESYATTSSGRRRRTSISSRHSRGSSGSSKVTSPSWVPYFSGSSGTSVRRLADDEDATGRAYVIKSSSGVKSIAKRRSSGNSESSGDMVSVRSRSPPPRRFGLTGMRDSLPLVESAPYAVSSRRGRDVRNVPVSLPVSPPVMDLSVLTYDMDWPSLIRDRLQHGGDLPTLVPPGSWRHTSAGGIGTDWFRRLDDIAVSDTQFDESEFEIVCRAWNKLVAQAWVRRTPGLNKYSNVDRLEFCARYFQSYFLLASAE